jgi:hypothetical protein
MSQADEALDNEVDLSSFDIDETEHLEHDENQQDESESEPEEAKIESEVSNTESPPEKTDSIPDDSPKWFRREIKKQAEDAKRAKLLNMALQKELEEVKSRANHSQRSGVVRPKPMLADYEDEDTYQYAVENWVKEQLPIKMELEHKARSYSDRIKSLGGKDYEVSERIVLNMLGQDSFLHLIDASSDPAALVLRLASSPETLNRIVNEKNPAKRLWELSKLEIATNAVRDRRESKAQVEEKVTSNSTSDQYSRLRKEYNDKLAKASQDATSYSDFSKFNKQNKDLLKKAGII